MEEVIHTLRDKVDRQDFGALAQDVCKKADRSELDNFNISM